MNTNIEKSMFLLYTLFFILLIAPISHASILLIPNIDTPQDAVDVAILIPEAGVGLAMIDFDQAAGTAFFAIIKDRNVIRYELRENVRVGEDLELIDNCMTAVTQTTSDNIKLVTVCDRPYVVLLANSIDYNLSRSFVDYLEGKGVDVIRSSAAEFEGYKDATTIIILGGPDSPEGVGDIVRNILTNNEQELVRVDGNKGMFVYDNPWHDVWGNTVTVLAGSNRHLTQKVALESMDRFILES